MVHLAAVVGVHLAAALLASRTFFQPDEYWQALEVAHRIVFGYGYRTWEWSRHEPVRSVAHPAVFVPLYAALAHISTHAYVLATAPAVQQALISAIGDWHAARLIARVAGPHFAYVWCVVHMSSIYWMYTASRTFSNTMEAALCSIALFYWPLSPHHAMRVSHSLRTYRAALTAVWLAVLMRPTSCIIWLLLGAKTMYSARRTCLWYVVREPVWIGAVVLGLGAWLDSLYYGRWVWTPLNFVRENLVHGTSHFYGMEAWHWYATVGLPSVLAVCTPYAIAGWWRQPQSLHMTRDPASVRTLLQMCAFTLCVYSCLQHKEVRFLQPLIPWLQLAAVLGMGAPPSITSVRRAFWSLPPWVRTCLFAQIPVALYVLAFHARAQVQVMSYLHSLRGAAQPQSVGFLLPCHSTPWQSHLHAAYLEAGGESGDAGLAWFLACPPPPRPDPAYWDQSDFFFHDPWTYLETRFPPAVNTTFPPMTPTSFVLPHSDAPHARYDLGWRHPWPSHMVVFSSLLSQSRGNTTVGDVLYTHGYTPVKRMWNALFHPDTHRRGEIVVLAHYSAGALASRDVNTA